MAIFKIFRLADLKNILVGFVSDWTMRMILHEKKYLLYLFHSTHLLHLWQIVWDIPFYNEFAI